MSSKAFGFEKPVKGNTDVWLTPRRIVDGFNVQFDLDPCAERGHELAKENFYEKGLEQKWNGLVWLNPPYSEVERWLDRLAMHGSGIALVFARTDTRWAQKHMHLASQVFFPLGRIAFLKQDRTLAGNAGAPSMFLGYGDTPLSRRVAPMKGWWGK